jgi:hypothetical protein
MIILRDILYPRRGQGEDSQHVAAVCPKCNAALRQINTLHPRISSWQSRHAYSTDMPGIRTEYGGVGQGPHRGLIFLPVHGAHVSDDMITR